MRTLCCDCQGKIFSSQKTDSLIDRAIQLAKTRNEDRERLVKLVQDLIAAKTDAEQARSLSQLISAGENGVVAIIDAFKDETLSPAASGRLDMGNFAGLARQRMSRSLRHFGTDNQAQKKPRRSAMEATRPFDQRGETHFGWLHRLWRTINRRS